MPLTFSLLPVQLVRIIFPQHDSGDMNDTNWSGARLEFGKQRIRYELEVKRQEIEVAKLKLEEKKTRKVQKKLKYHLI